MLSTCFSTGSLSQASPGEALRRLRFLQRGEQLAHLAQRHRESSRPWATRCYRRAEQVAEHRHLHAPSVSRTAGPDRPPRSTRSHTSVISPFGSTSAATRLSSPELFQLRDKIAQVAIFHMTAGRPAAIIGGFAATSTHGTPLARRPQPISGQGWRCIIATRSRRCCGGTASTSRWRSAGSPWMHRDRQPKRRGGCRRSCQLAGDGTLQRMRQRHPHSQNAVPPRSVTLRH